MTEEISEKRKHHYQAHDIYYTAEHLMGVAYRLIKLGPDSVHPDVIEAAVKAGELIDAQIRKNQDGLPGRDFIINHLLEQLTPIYKAFKDEKIIYPELRAKILFVLTITPPYFILDADTKVEILDESLALLDGEALLDLMNNGGEDVPAKIHGPAEAACYLVGKLFNLSKRKVETVKAEYKKGVGYMTGQDSEETESKIFMLQKSYDLAEDVARQEHFKLVSMRQKSPLAAEIKKEGLELLAKELASVLKTDQENLPT